MISLTEGSLYECRQLYIIEEKNIYLEHWIITAGREFAGSLDMVVQSERRSREINNLNKLFNTTEAILFVVTLMLQKKKNLLKSSQN